MAFHYQDVARFFAGSRIPLDFTETAFHKIQAPFSTIVQEVEAAILRSDSRCDFPSKIEAFHFSPLINLLADSLETIIEGYNGIISKGNPQRAAVEALEAQINQATSVLYRIYCTVWGFEGVRMHNLYAHFLKFSSNLAIIELMFDMVYYLFIARDWQKSDLEVTKYFLAFGTPFLKLIASFGWDYEKFDEFILEKLPKLSMNEKKKLFNSFGSLGERLIKVLEEEASEADVLIPEMILRKIFAKEEKLPEEKSTGFFGYLGEITLGVILLRPERETQRKCYSLMAIAQSLTSLIVHLSDGRRYLGLAGNINNLQFYREMRLILPVSYIHVLFKEFQDVKKMIETEEPEKKKMVAMRRFYRLVDGVSNNSVILAPVFSEKALEEFHELAAMYLLDRKEAGDSYFFQIMSFILEEYKKVVNEEKWKKAKNIKILGQEYRDILIETLNSLFIGFTEFLNRFIERGRSNRIGTIELPSGFSGIFRKTMDLVIETIMSRDLLKEDYCEPLWVIFRFLNLRTQDLHRYYETLYLKYEEIASLAFEPSFEINLKSACEANKEVPEGLVRKEMREKYTKLVHKLAELMVKACRMGQWENSPFSELFDKMVTSRLWGVVIEKSHNEEKWSKLCKEEWKTEQIEAARESGYRWILVMMTLQKNATEGGIQFFVDETFKKISDSLISFSEGDKYKMLYGFQQLFETFEIFEYDFPFVQLARKLVIYVYRECLTDVDAINDSMESVQVDLVGNEMVNLFTNPTNEQDTIEYTKTWLQKVGVSLKKTGEYLDQELMRLNEYLEGLRIEAGAKRGEEVKQSQEDWKDTIYIESKLEVANVKDNNLGLVINDVNSIDGIGEERLNAKSLEVQIERKRQKYEEYFMLLLLSKLGYLNQVLEMMAGCLIFEQMGVDSETLEHIQGILKQRWMNYCCNYFKMNYVYIFWDFYSDCLVRSGIKGGGSEIYKVISRAYKALEAEALRGNIEGMLSCLRILPSEETELVLHTREKFIINKYGGLRTGLFTTIYVVKTIEVMSEIFLNARWYSSTQDISIITDMEKVFEWAFLLYKHCLKGKLQHKGLRTHGGKELWSEYDPIFDCLLKNGLLEAARSHDPIVENLLKILCKVMVIGESDQNKEQDRIISETFRLKWVFNIMKRALEKENTRDMMKKFVEYEEKVVMKKVIEWIENVSATLEKTGESDIETLEDDVVGTTVMLLETLENYFGSSFEADEGYFQDMERFYGVLLKLVLETDQLLPSKKWAVRLWVPCVKIYRAFVKKMACNEDQAQEEESRWAKMVKRIKVNLQGHVGRFTESMELGYRVLLEEDPVCSSTMEGFVNSNLSEKFPYAVLEKASEVMKVAVSKKDIPKMELRIPMMQIGKSTRDILLVLKLETFSGGLLKNQREFGVIEAKKALERVQELGIERLAGLEVELTEFKETELKIYFGFVAYMLTQEREENFSEKILEAIKKHTEICLKYSQKMKTEDHAKKIWGKEFVEAITAIYIAVIRLITTKREAFVKLSHEKELLRDLFRLGSKVEGVKNWSEVLLGTIFLDSFELKAWYDGMLRTFYSKELRNVNIGSINIVNGGFKDPMVALLDEHAMVRMEAIFQEWEETSGRKIEISIEDFLKENVSPGVERVLRVLVEVVLEDLEGRVGYLNDENENNNELETSIKTLTWVVNTFSWAAFPLVNMKFNLMNHKGLQRLHPGGGYLTFAEILIKICAVVTPLGTKQLINSICSITTPYMTMAKGQDPLHGLFVARAMSIESVKPFPENQLEMNHWTINTILDVFRRHLKEAIEKKQVKVEFLESWQWGCWSKAILKPISQGTIEVLETMGEEIVNLCLTFAGDFLGNDPQDVYWEGFRDFLWTIFFIIIKNQVTRWANGLGVGNKLNTKPQFLYYLLIQIKKKHCQKKIRSTSLPGSKNNIDAVNGNGEVSHEKEEEYKLNGEEIYGNISGFPSIDEHIRRTYLLVEKSKNEQETYDANTVSKACMEIKALGDFYNGDKKVNVEKWSQRFVKIYQKDPIEKLDQGNLVEKGIAGSRGIFEEDLLVGWSKAEKLIGKNKEEKKVFENVTKLVRNKVREELKGSKEEEEKEEKNEYEMVKEIIEEKGASLKRIFIEKLEKLHVLHGREGEEEIEEIRTKGIEWYQGLGEFEKKALICMDSGGFLKEILGEEENEECRRYKVKYEREIKKIKDVIKDEQRGSARRNRSIVSGEEEVEIEERIAVMRREEIEEDEFEYEYEEDDIGELENFGMGEEEEFQEDGVRIELGEFDYETCRSLRSNSVGSMEDIADLVNRNEEEASGFLEDKKKELTGQRQEIVRGLPRINIETLKKVMELWGKTFPCWGLLYNFGENLMMLDMIIYMKILACADENEKLMVDVMTMILAVEPEELNLKIDGEEAYKRLSIGIVTFLNTYLRDFPDAIVGKSGECEIKKLLKKGEDNKVKEMGYVRRILERMIKEKDRLVFRKLVDLFVVMMRGLEKFEVTENDDILFKMMSLMKSELVKEDNKLLSRLCVGLRELIRVSKRLNGVEKALNETIERILEENKADFEERVKTLRRFRRAEEITAGDYEVMQGVLSSDVGNLADILSVLERYLYYVDDKKFRNKVMEKLKEHGIIKKICEIVSLWQYLREKNSKDWHIIRKEMLKFFEIALYLHSLMTRQEEAGTGVRAQNGFVTSGGKSSVKSKAGGVIDEMEIEQQEVDLERMESVIIENKESISVVIEVDPGRIIQRDDLLKMVGGFSGLIDMDRKRMILKYCHWGIDNNCFHRKYLSQNLKIRNLDDSTGFAKVRVRRDKILEDTLTELAYISGEDLRTWNFSIIFDKEAGIDAGGLTAEWISLVLKELYGPEQGLFKLSHNEICLYPNPFSYVIPSHLSYFRLAGQMTALSIREEVLCRIPFTRGFLKQILGKRLDIEDLEEIDPQLAKSLKHLLQCGEEDLSYLEQPFVFEMEHLGEKIVQELVPGGSEIIVDEKNKEEYVNRLVQEMLVKSVSEQVKEFSRGFYEVLPMGVIKMFLPYELELLVCGRSEIGVEDLKSLIRYVGYTVKDNIIKWFWEVMEEYTEEERTSFLFFVTGSSALPPKGYGDIKIVIKKCYASVTCLPIAHTCFNEMELPEYVDKETLKMKLDLAISEGKEGFHIV